MSIVKANILKNPLIESKPVIAPNIISCKELQKKDETLTLKVVNHNFYNSAQALVIAILELVSNKIREGQEVPYETKPKYRVKKDNSCSVEYVQTVSVPRLILILKKEIESYLSILHAWN